MTTYTVLAVYEDDFQPYATTVEANDPEEAMEGAQAQADESNGGHIPLIGFQVVLGTVEVIA